MLVSDFDNMEWLNAPSGDEKDNSNPHFLLSDEDKKQALILYPPQQKDFWRETFYSPRLVKDDGCAFLRRWPLDRGDCTATVLVDLTAVHQFDQGGLLVRVGPKHWIKAGFEYVDKEMRLSCVVTNDWSDWSTQPWPSEKRDIIAREEGKSGTVREVREGLSCHASAWLRIHRVRGSSVVVEAAATTESKKDSVPPVSKFSMVRICRLVEDASSQKIDDDEGDDGSLGWRIGPFAASPTQAGGCIATFTCFEVGPRVDTAHSENL